MAKIAEVTSGNWTGLRGDVVKESKKLVYVRRPGGGMVPVNREHVIIAEPQPIALDPQMLTMTDGYVGSFGKTWETPTAETLEIAITGAMRENGMTREQVVEALVDGRALKWGVSPNYYYDHSDAIIGRKREARPVEMVRCDCGHSVPQDTRMMASLGTSCPDCYDRMSD